MALLPTERQFIRNHISDDVRSLLLSAHSPELDIKKVVAQIAARQKAQHKLPSWFANDALVFPPALSVEQASSERTAHYKASLVSGQRLIDVTGGMGVDSWAFAQRVEQVMYIEQQADLANLAGYNLPLLGATNVVVRAGNGLDVINELTQAADWLYLDPHRRNEQGNKVVQLADCEPDISKADVLAGLLTKTNRILLKTSPLIDIDATIRQLTSQSVCGIERVDVVAIQGEVKEVLFVIGQAPFLANDVVTTAVNLTALGDIRFQFNKGDERSADIPFGDPQRYVYEPNAAVLKAGAFRLVAARFNLTKLSPNSHLYTSDELRPDFPGRAFELQHVIKPDRKALQALVPGLKANLTVRNFPQTVAELRKKLTLQEGGNTYILATTLLNGEKRLLITTKANLSERQ
ncbi:SAM-dependent methyltransferase [Spirosoma soli]|uniref:SAM-dependent methyltransferase n=1 Tax=Spirosoma soli TaxID=1770529 RepID=A0ABW5M4P9_9BACT